MTSIVPTPYAATYSATKIFSDFIALGLQHELCKYNVDVCTWRAFNIKRKPEDPVDFMTCSPEEYVEAALSKCTSGVHYGFWKHELMGLIIENLKDIVPIDIPMKYFASTYK